MRALLDGFFRLLVARLGLLGRAGQALRFLDIEDGIGDLPEVLGERGRDKFPLRLPVRERASTA